MIFWKKTLLLKKSNPLFGIAMKAPGTDGFIFGLCLNVSRSFKNDIMEFVTGLLKEEDANWVLILLLSLSFQSWKYPDYMLHNLVSVSLGGLGSKLVWNPLGLLYWLIEALLLNSLIGHSNITLSHIFYADDVIITIDCNHRDMDNIIRVLQVFYLASGLKINIHKSNVYGVGVSDNEVHSMANDIGCSLGSFPFTYLGLPIGANMNLGSLKSFNLALLQKWRWRMMSNTNALWVKIVKAFHGQEGGFGLNEISSKDKNASSYRIVSETTNGSGTGLVLLEGLGFPPNDGMFSVSSTRKHIDSCFLPVLDIPTKWNKIVPRLTFPRLGVLHTTSFLIVLLLMIFGGMSATGVSSHFLLVLCLITGRFGSILGMRQKKRNGVYLLFLQLLCGGFGSFEIA
ncbi:hypothetical protein Tco_1270138 [Tanacetum coccineum]